MSTKHEPSLLPFSNHKGMESAKNDSVSIDRVEPGNLFPLPLTAFERFMIADESADYPMTFYLRIRLRGILDREIARRAFDVALSRHPLLRCHIRKDRLGPSWVWAGEQELEFIWLDGQNLNHKAWRTPIDLAKQIGLRVWGTQEPDHAVLTMQFHHACCDGVGAAQFMEDVVIAYTRIFATSTGPNWDLPEFRSLDVDLLKNRNSREGRRIANIRGSVIRRSRILLKYSLRYLREQKLSLLPNSAKVQVDHKQQDLGLISTKLTRAETKGLRKVSMQHGSTLNDLLVRELMLTANTRLAGSTRISKSLLRWKQPTICVLVPVSLRGPSDHEIPACNVVSYIFLSQRKFRMEQPIELLTAIRDDMRLVHRYQAGWFFVQAIESVQKVPGLMRLLMWRNRNRCMSTTVLSHMGNLFSAIGSRLPRKDGLIQMGDLQVEDICGIPPVRKGTAAAFSSIMINGRLSISIRCCPDRFTESETRELLSMFTDRLRQTAASIIQSPETGKLSAA